MRMYVGAVIMVSIPSVGQRSLPACLGSWKVDKWVQHWARRLEQEIDGVMRIFGGVQQLREVTVLEWYLVGSDGEMSGFSGGPSFSSVECEGIRLEESLRAGGGYSDRKVPEGRAWVLTSLINSEPPAPGVLQGRQGALLGGFRVLGESQQGAAAQVPVEAVDMEGTGCRFEPVARTGGIWALEEHPSFSHLVDQGPDSAPPY
ncbi:hypothetical protein MJG53_016250 [Ovis ammon polii x Ovis aries]|uniref:Uncharacterized protein n=1 Tax=Ovis ammon polii x Ovis aries TaxID=2918886 RepID=A0ACB9UAV8_9CETA|nr:hypothetical protein MJG53_016250 [Ovis ammon polii x Ovis aries]